MENGFEEAMNSLIKDGRVGRVKLQEKVGVSAQIARSAILAYDTKYKDRDAPLGSSELELDMVFSDMPDGIDTELPLLKLMGRKILVMGDLHFPIHDKKAVLTALRRGVDYGCDTIYLNGDILDSHKLSIKYLHHKSAVSYQMELDMVSEFLTMLRKSFFGAEIYYKSGNHEDRLETLLMSRAPDIADLSALTLPNLLRLADTGVHYVESKQLATVCGSLFIGHGHEFKSFFGGGVAHARNTRIRAGENVMFNHFHRTDENSGPSLGGRVTTAYALGCMCKLNPAYVGKSVWNHGFALIESDHVNFQVQNIRI